MTYEFEGDESTTRTLLALKNHSSVVYPIDTRCQVTQVTVECSIREITRRTAQ